MEMKRGRNRQSFSWTIGARGSSALEAGAARNDTGDRGPVESLLALRHGAQQVIAHQAGHRHRDQRLLGRAQGEANVLAAEGELEAGGLEASPQGFGWSVNTPAPSVPAQTVDGAPPAPITAKLRTLTPSSP
jgi:hypothetical protein